MVALAFFIWGKWLLNWSIIYGVLVEYGPPGVFQKNLALSTENKKTPLKPCGIKTYAIFSPAFVS